MTIPGSLGNWVKSRLGGRWSAATRFILFLFLIQIITGVLLMTAYVPSVAGAWGSVWHIEAQTAGGWMVRGVHQITSDLLVLTCALCVLHALWRRAFRSHHELSWWAIIGLAVVVQAAALTGELLPWDQQGYWGTVVRTNILGQLPIIGKPLREVVLGGKEIGQATLTRFHALHTVALPLVVFALLRLARRHSTASAESRSGLVGDDGIAVRRAILRLVSLLTIGLAVWYARHRAGTSWLESPADPLASDYPARPEWYSLALYQWLQYFSGAAAQTIGLVVIPSAAFALVLAFPWLDRILSARAATRLAIAAATVLIGAHLSLTFLSLREDRLPDSELANAVQRKRSAGEDLSENEQRAWQAIAFHAARDREVTKSNRAKLLAAQLGIPPEGAAELLANDPMTRGPELFAQHCATCHRFHGHDGTGIVPQDAATSSDLGGFGSRPWIAGFLQDPMDSRYFGLMTREDGAPAHTKMQRWLSDFRDGASTPEERASVEADLAAAAVFLACQSGGSDHCGDSAEKGSEAQRGREVFMNACNECHSFQGERSGTLRAPEMHGYGSVAWISLMITDPDHDTLYRSRGKEKALMPPFRDRLSKREVRLIAEWIHDTREAGQ